MQVCSRCGIEKALEAFGRDSRRPNGRKSWCKDCQNEWKRGRPPEVKRMERQSWIQRNREQVAAQKAVRKAVARGTLVRPDACEGCGRVAYVQAHHDDYSQRFTVRWLCAACHAETHMARVRVDMRLPEELVAAVDEARGDVTRTRFVERALEKALGEPHRVPSTGGVGTSGENPAIGGVPGASGEPALAPSRASDPSPAGRKLTAAYERQMRLNKAKGL